MKTTKKSKTNDDVDDELQKEILQGLKLQNELAQTQIDYLKLKMKYLKLDMK